MPVSILVFKMPALTIPRNHCFVTSKQSPCPTAQRRNVALTGTREVDIANSAFVTAEIAFRGDQDRRLRAALRRSATAWRQTSPSRPPKRRA